MNINTIAKELSSAQLLGVGESSHGTHEFFDFKSKLFQELVKSHGFNTLLFEDSAETCELINQFIKTVSSDLDELMKRLYPVWQVKEFKELLLSMRNMRANGERVEFIGFDINQTTEDMQKRDELMAGSICRYVAANPDTKAMVWAHNSHIQIKGSDFNLKPTGLFLKEKFGQKYVALGLLFGKGRVSATRLKADVPPGKDRSLSVINVNSIPSDLTESLLDSLYDQQTFLTKGQMNKISINSALIRSIGWGVVPESINEAVEQADIKEAFDAVLYFPDSTPSRSLL
jgi:erythromycin esterase-like protein